MVEKTSEYKYIWMYKSKKPLKTATPLEPYNLTYHHALQTLTLASKTANNVQNCASPHISEEEGLKMSATLLKFRLFLTALSMLLFSGISFCHSLSDLTIKFTYNMVLMIIHSCSQQGIPLLHQT